jgi:hypothetical protein
MEKSAGIFLSRFSALAGGRSAHRPCDQRSSHADLGFGGRRRSLDEGLWQRPLAGDDGNPGAGHSPRLRRHPLAISLATSKSLVEYARERLARHYAAAGASPETVEEAKHLFDPNALTLGFARRFATYKRPNLLLHDPERLLRLLSNPQRPVQLIIAGKAHPADLAGQALIQKWIQFIRRPEVRPHAIFLSDYDMHLTERLVQGWMSGSTRHGGLGRRVARAA